MLDDADLGFRDTPELWPISHELSWERTAKPDEAEQPREVRLRANPLPGRPVRNYPAHGRRKPVLSWMDCKVQMQAGPGR